MRIAYFTAGSTGAGHFVRGYAIGRALARRAAGAVFRMFGPALPFPSLPTGAYEPVAIDAAELRSPARARGSSTARALLAFRPDVVLCDLFWAPLRHVLPLLEAEAWLLVRRCPERWFQEPSDMSWDGRLFARVIAIEPGANAAARETMPPIVVCNPDERRPVGALRARIGVGRGDRLVVTAHAGRRRERAALDGGGASARLDLFDPDALFPLAEWLGDADEIRCGGGYNTYWEARWLGYSDRCWFTAFARRIDDQAWRLSACGDHRPRENGADVLARALA